MNQSNKPKEFWITFGVLTNKLELKALPDQFNGCENLHVIEYSAYEEVDKLNKELTDEVCRKFEHLETRIERLREALEFYAGNWGPHHGNDDRTNLIIMETLNRAGFKARESLQADDEMKEEGIKNFNSVRGGHKARSHGDFAEKMIYQACLKEKILALQIPTGAKIRKFGGRLVPIPIKTPFDFILYLNGKSVTLDIKFIEGDHFNYSWITPHQVESLLKIQETKNEAGYLIFFEKINQVVFFPASQLSSLKPRQSLKPQEGILIGSILAFNLSLLF